MISIATMGKFIEQFQEPAPVPSGGGFIGGGPGIAAKDHKFPVVRIKKIEKDEDKIVLSVENITGD